MNLSVEATLYLYHHVILPPNLPQQDDRSASHERSLLEVVIQALEHLMTIANESHLGTVTSAVAMIKNLRGNRDVHGDVTETQLQTQLADLTAGTISCPVPLEIKAQNACILISRDDEYLNFEFFELSPTNEAAMRSIRLKRTFPGYASRIPVDRMKSLDLQKSIAFTIAKMATQPAPGFQPQARKNGKDEDENRDTTAPGLVTDFFMTMITVLGEATDVKRIVKATREDVLWSDCEQPWRRSPLWLLVRVSLQIWFNRNATFVTSPDSLYKGFMICMLSKLLQSARANWNSLGRESLHNISAKLIRRIRKFELLKQSDCLRSCWTESTKHYLLDAHTVITQQWKSLNHSTVHDIDITAVTGIHPDKDLDLKLPALDTFLSRMRARQHEHASSSFRPSSVFPSFPAAYLPEDVGGSEEYKYFYLAAFENWVGQHLGSWISLHLYDTATCRDLRRLIEHYFVISSAAYAGSPIGKSIMYLTLAELWIASDKSACAQYALLPEYDNEFCTKEFRCLVLPLKHHMKRLQEIERYVDSRRKAALSNLPSVYRKFGHPSSFAVRYFERSSDHQVTLANIECDAERKRSQKCKELKELKTDHDNLMNKYNSTICDTETYVYNRRYGYTSTRHPNWCQRCSFKRRADALSIHIYEWPVSSNPSIAKATVFELNIPQPFSEWRDTCTYMINEVLCHRTSYPEKPSYSSTLEEHPDLSRMLAPWYCNRRIVLSSEVKPHHVTHRKHKKSVPNLTEDDVCLQSALRYAYFDTSLGISTAVAPTCTEDVPKLCMYHMPQRSKALERFMYRPPSAPDGTPANEVIASVSDCPPHFSVEEYKAFGAIPFGREIIYANLITQLATSVIDFSRVETQCLLLQTVQQVGLPSGYVERTNHAVMVDESFGQAILEQLELALRRVSENWESWRATASFSLLARRVLSLTRSPEVRMRALDYLVELRLACFKWLQRLKIRAATSTNDDQRNELTSRATEIALLCTSTYDVEGDYLDTVLLHDTAISVLLQSSITIQENCDSIQSDDQELYKSLLQSHRAMMYRLCEKLRTLILNDSTGLCEAVTANWAVFDPSKTSNWDSLEEPQHHWLFIKFGTLLVHFNLLTAQLLVMGLPLARLPSKYMQHERYKTLFSTSILEVIPTDEPGLEYSARNAYRDYKLHFGMQGSDMLVVAVQSNSRLDLIPSRVFQGRLPHAFVSDFIHWYDHTRNEVIFRPRKCPWISGSDCWHLKRDVSTKDWRLVNGTYVLANLTSTTAVILSRMVQSIEESQHIHVLLDTATRTTNLNLPRLQLSFFIEPDSDAIYSRQFRGMTIDSQQTIGSLTGLISKLVLKTDQSERMVLIPVPRKFGQSSIKYTKILSSHHVKVEICKDDATKVYAYNIDKDLGRIIDSGDLESKLLMSYLHAITSSCLPDPLTGLTGTEAALQILQSAAVRSFDILTHRNIELLEQIATLSTRRSFYPKHLNVMQQTSWNKNLPSLSQHPHFRTSVDQIFVHAAKMKVFFPGNDVFEAIQDVRERVASESILDRRALVRTTNFHVTGSSAEQLTVFQDDEYIGRDTQRQEGRSEQATIAATLVLRDRFAIHKPILNLKDALLRKHFSNDTIEGFQSSVELSSLRYDSKWLGESSTHLKRMWCSLHQCLVTETSEVNIFDIMLWLSTMAYAESADMDVIQALAALYKDPEFGTIFLPSARIFKLAAGSIWRHDEARNILVRESSSFDDSAEASLPRQGYETGQEHINRIEQLFRKNQGAAVQSFSNALQQQWPVRRLSTPTFTAVSKYINVGASMKDVTSKCEDWFDNREFSQYLDQVSKLCARQKLKPVNQPCYIISVPISREALSHHLRKHTSEDIFAAEPPAIFRLGSSHDVLPKPCEPRISLQAQSLPLNDPNISDRLEQLCCSLQNYATSMSERDYVEKLRASCAALDGRVDTIPGLPKIDPNVPELLQNYLCACETFLENLNHALIGCVRGSSLFSVRIGLSTDHSIRLGPQFWLRQLHRDRFKLLSDEWKSTIIGYGVAITHLHRAARLAALSNKPVDLCEELTHVGHSNWDPSQFPETLLIEAESGIMVRKEQEFIASHMRHPKDGHNSVMQLQMGGGKSSTIVPIVAAYLTDKETLVRVISAKAQSHQMHQMLVSKLGGLLDRRIYHMPFSRNLRLTLADAKSIQKLYEECVRNSGVLLIQPEHVLSFKLMAIESVITDQSMLARSMLATQEYFDRVTRDIIDEVDENLSVKFELIYTMGSQEHIDFAPDRWLIIQQVLTLLPRIAFQVKKHLPEAIDIQDYNDERFPRVRLLRQDGTDEFLDSLAHEIVDSGLSGLPTRSQSDEMRASIFRYITQTNLNAEDIRAVEKSKFWSDSTKNALLLVRGLIAGGVLRFTLSTKRWRVNYGLDKTRTPSTALAVPYRSKDSPSPRSEFSHSDVVLILTLLSQYYGGLSDEQMFDTLAHVLNSDQRDIHYHEFVRTASSSLPAAFRHISGLSIRDRQQCLTELFPALRYSKNAIDYYLAHLVFPKQCKQFPQKLSASGWDLSTAKTHPTTGFSGTNDTLHLLPLEIEHLDLPSQTYTNAQVLAYLLKDETAVKLLPRCTNEAMSDGEHLLTFVEDMDSKVRVILDCGAAILELNNREVAKAWLRMHQIDGDVEAVVYFEDERLSVMDHAGRIEPFQTSPYAKQLDLCIVYLDESHTRGTDLKLPRDYRAVVTLGAQLTKDRLTQACMRLRKLGHGQSVTFIIPPEIGIKIRELTAMAVDGSITVKDVICWSILETWQDLRRSMPLWAVQGKRFESHKHLLNGENTTKGQAEAFLEDEAQGLETRYKPTAKDDKMVAQLVGWDLSNKNIAHIVSRCRDFEAIAFGSAALSEEQERELSPEIEEERQVERPPKMEAETHVLHPELVYLVNHGYLKRHSTIFESAFKALRCTSPAKLFNLEQTPSFPTDLLVTEDFMRTVKIPSGCSYANCMLDPYQRPVQFVITASSLSGGKTVMNAVVISPFEANELQPIIRRTKKVTLHLFAPRSNGGYESLDQLMLYNIGCAFTPQSLSRSLTMQLNLFAGSLYLRSLTEYNEMCDFLGLLRTLMVKRGQQVHADGFIEPPAGEWGLKQSPVPFLRALLMKVRREGKSVEKTHLGKLLSGMRLEEADF